LIPSKPGCAVATPAQLLQHSVSTIVEFVTNVDGMISAWFVAMQVFALNLGGEM
jgi:hypothetical protein